MELKTIVTHSVKVSVSRNSVTFQRIIGFTRLLAIFHVRHYSSDMPIYEFHCEHCAKDSEILVRSTRWEGTTCPNCGASKLTKKLSVFASSVAGSSAEPSCTGQPRSCGLCGTGKAHSH